MFCNWNNQIIVIIELGTGRIRLFQGAYVYWCFVSFYYYVVRLSWRVLSVFTCIATSLSITSTITWSQLLAVVTYFFPLHLTHIQNLRGILCLWRKWRHLRLSIGVDHVERFGCIRMTCHINTTLPVDCITWIFNLISGRVWSVTLLHIAFNCLVACVDGCCHLFTPIASLLEIGKRYQRASPVTQTHVSTLMM